MATQLSAAPSKNTKKAHTDVARNAAGSEDATKLGSSGQSTDVVRKHRGKLYYENGNVVLISEKVAFRVHRMFLASRSEAFKRMFELASHPKDGEYFDGCPAIHLDDKVEDLTAFLGALYGHIAIKHIEPDFPKFSAVLRLSSKYIVDTLRSPCIRHLSLEKVPRTLDAYHAHYYPKVADFHFCYYNLVYEIGATCLLPGLFYIISTFDEIAIDQRTTGLNLRDDDMVRLYKGKSNLLDEYGKIIHELELNKKKGDCSSCPEEEKESVIENMLIDLTQLDIDRFDPLRCLYDARQSAEDCDNLCDACLLKLRNQLDEARQQIWDALPRIFNFAHSWDQLECP